MAGNVRKYKKVIVSGCKKTGSCLREYFFSDGIKVNRIFIIGLLFGDILFWVMQAIMQGNWIDSYFVNDYHDTGMDYFNMLACLNTDNPYSLDASYPPMCFLILKVFFRFIPDALVGGNGFYYRELMQAQILYIMFMLAMVIAVWEFVRLSYKGANIDKVLLALGVIFSGPFLFVLERGNLILFSFTCLLVFISYYNAEEKGKRWCAYIALALSASVKMYPAVFGILILYRKRYKEAVWVLFAGIIIFVMPFFAFDGIDSIRYLIHGIEAVTDLTSNLGMGYNFSFINLVKIAGSFLGIKVQEPIMGRFVLPVFICGMVYLLGKDEWKKVYAAVLLCIWIPDFSYTYTLLLFIIPMLCCLKVKEEFSFFSYIYRALFVFILVPLCLPSMAYMDYGAKFFLTMPTLVINLAICLLTAMILAEGIMERVLGKYRNVAKAIVRKPGRKG